MLRNKNAPSNKWALFWGVWPVKENAHLLGVVVATTIHAGGCDGCDGGDHDESARRVPTWAAAAAAALAIAVGRDLKSGRRHLRLLFRA